MRNRAFCRALTSIVFTLLLALPLAVRAQAAPGPGQIPVDSWPHTVAAGGDTLTVYEPQVESWQGNVLRARAAIGVETPALPKPTYGVVHYTARTASGTASSSVKTMLVSALQKVRFRMAVPG